MAEGEEGRSNCKDNGTSAKGKVVLDKRGEVSAEWKDVIETGIGTRGAVAVIAVVGCIAIQVACNVKEMWPLNRSSSITLILVSYSFIFVPYSLIS